MTVPPLFDHFDTEDEDQLRRDMSAPLDAGFEADAEHRAMRAHLGGVRERAQAWLHVEPFYWVMRVVYVGLAAGAVFAVYINGVAEGWWRAWGEKPSVAATAPVVNPTPAPSVSSEAAMSGGYQIGPDGVLVRPAEHAASTYTKPELPDEAKENTERGAELAAEYYLATLAYAWNTGDTLPFEAVSDPNDSFRNKFISDIHATYSSGWTFGNTITIDHILQVNPQPADGKDVPPNSVLVVFLATTSDGTTCRGKNAVSSAEESQLVFALLMTWRDGTWIAIQGGSESAHGK